ncbi:MAG: hypothetical protein OEZ43_18590 [Gammaproteobacteria bacterium]|nr:hypothetical protein [Gammaproteobacteria bacterium]
MKKIGKLLGIAGFALVILFPPYNMLGHVEWGFILSNIVGAFGKGVPVYEHINYVWLVGELAVVALISFLVMRQR